MSHKKALRPRGGPAVWGTEVKANHEELLDHCPALSRYALRANLSQNRSVGSGCASSSRPATTKALFGEYVFGADSMDADVAVNQLGNIDVDCHAGEHVGVIAAQVLLLHEEIDHVAYGERRSFF